MGSKLCSQFLLSQNYGKMRGTANGISETDKGLEDFQIDSVLYVMREMVDKMLRLIPADHVNVYNVGSSMLQRWRQYIHRHIGIDIGWFSVLSRALASKAEVQINIFVDHCRFFVPLRHPPREGLIDQWE